MLIELERTAGELAVSQERQAGGRQLSLPLPAKTNSFLSRVRADRGPWRRITGHATEPDSQKIAIG